MKKYFVRARPYAVLFLFANFSFSVSMYAILSFADFRRRDE